MRRSALVLALLGLFLLCSQAFASPDTPAPMSLPGCAVDAPRPGPWAVEFGTSDLTPPEPLRVTDDGQAAAPVRRAVAVDYSDAYKVRAKIHKVASFATLPLFVANYIVGQDLYKNHTESKKSLHVGLVTGSAVLFGVNTATGVWNLWEGRKDSNHRAKRMTHGILMIAADIGFLATAAMAPDDDHERFGATAVTSGNSASRHRAVAVTSMGIATVSYLMMLLGGR
jgi:hypothetical protein